MLTGLKRLFSSKSAGGDARPSEASARGDALLRRGELEAALACFREAELTDDSPGLGIKLGFVLKELGRKEEAEACLRKAVSADPDIADAQYMLGSLELECG